MLGVAGIGLVAELTAESLIPRDNSAPASRLDQTESSADANRSEDLNQFEKRCEEGYEKGCDAAADILEANISSDADLSRGKKLRQRSQEIC